MTTIQRLQELGLGQFVNFDNEEANEAVRMFICADKYASGIEAIKVLKAEGYKEGVYILEVKISEILTTKNESEFFVIFENEVYDYAKKPNRYEVVYSSENK